MFADQNKHLKGFNEMGEFPGDKTGEQASILTVEKRNKME